MAKKEPAGANGAPSIELIPVIAIHASATNPRKRFDGPELQELEDSIRAHGVLQPVLARKRKGTANVYELVAGERRWRAAQRAGLVEIPAIVRELKDEEVLEIQLVENLARADLHPLEEAAGYELLHTRHGYSVETIAAKLGRSRKYVYDRIKLLALTDEAKEHFLAGRITAGHAILLARLDEEAQKKALDFEEGGVFREERLLFGPEPDAGPDPIAPVSVLELKSWIDEHVRFDVEEVDQMVFPETAEVLDAATAEEATVLAITHEYVLRPDQKGASKTLTCKAWKRADGRKGSKTCEHKKPACIVIGYGRGEAFDVCTAKDKCKVHWASEMREKAKRAKQRGAAPPGADKAAREKAEAKAAEKRRAGEEAHKRFIAAGPAIEDACAAACTKATAKLACAIIEHELCANNLSEHALKLAAKKVPRGDSAEEILRYLAWAVFPQVWEDSWYADDPEVQKLLKAAGIDLGKLLDEHAPVEKPKPEPKAPAKKKRGKAAAK